MYKPKKKDIFLATLVIAVLGTLVMYMSKAESNEHPPTIQKLSTGVFLDVGFGLQDNNVFCRNKDTQNLYGIAEVGYQFDESMTILYRHNSCVDKETDEGTLDSIEFKFRFKDWW